MDRTAWQWCAVEWSTSKHKLLTWLLNRLSRAVTTVPLVAAVVPHYRTAYVPRGCFLWPADCLTQPATGSLVDTMLLIAVTQPARRRSSNKCLPVANLQCTLCKGLGLVCKRTV